MSVTTDLPSYKTLAINGLWKKNPALVQLLGLCPLLGVSNSAVNAIGLALATLVVLVCSNAIVSLFRHHTPEVIRLPIYVLLIAALTTCTELIMQAFAYELYQILGIFLPLIVTNCIILGRADSFANKQPVHIAAFDGLMMGAGFGAVLVILGMLRELLGQGTLFANMHLLFGANAVSWKLIIFPHYEKFILALLPPGAFIFMGFMVAVKNWIERSWV